MPETEKTMPKRAKKRKQMKRSAGKAAPWVREIAASKNKRNEGKPLSGTFGPASPVRRLDPKTMEPIEEIAPKAGKPASKPRIRKEAKTSWAPVDFKAMDRREYFAERDAHKDGKSVCRNCALFKTDRCPWPHALATDWCDKFEMREAA